jgi:hypothetical protein
VCIAEAVRGGGAVSRGRPRQPSRRRSARSRTRRRWPRWGPAGPTSGYRHTLLDVPAKGHLAGLLAVSCGAAQPTAFDGTLPYEPPDPDAEHRHPATAGEFSVLRIETWQS